MDAIYVDAESHGYYGDDEPPESVVLVGEGGSIEYVPAGEYHWLRDFLNGIAAKCGTKDCSSLVEYVRQLEGKVDELRELARFIMHQCNDCNPRCDECIGWNGGECVALLRMRELEVEVDA